MDEYFGQSAKKYKQPQDKYYSLFPALDKALPKAKKDQSLLDLGCGTGDLFSFVEDKGYLYTGADISEDMLEEAKRKHSFANFIKVDATKLNLNFNSKFDVVLSNMLFPSISNRDDFNSIFELTNSLLKDSGLMILSAGHSCFDGYMQRKLFNRETIETNFEGYFKSGQNYKVHRKFDGNDFIFSDHHWTLSDYLKSAKKAGFLLSDFDECPLSSNAPVEIFEKYNQRGTPSYMVFVFTKQS